MKIKELLKYGRDLAVKQGKEENAIKLLLMHFLCMKAYELVKNFDEEVEDTLAEKFKQKVFEYVFENIPVQYIIGHAYFYGRKFTVGPDVLIPRFETEELVFNVLRASEKFFKGKSVTVLDIGTGSGVIGITLSLEKNDMEVHASDISSQALVIAKENADRLGARIDFYAGDMLNPFINNDKKYDVLVSNPPYVSETDYVDKLVKNNEPNISLYGGKSGIKFYEQILKDAKKVLKPKSIIAFEHGFNQLEAITTLVRKYLPDARVENIKDINGRDRIIIIYILR